MNQQIDPRGLSRPHVWRPSENPKQAPTLLLLHGTGADEYDLLNLGTALMPSANLLSVRGLVSEHGMNRFFVRFADGSFDEQSIIDNVEDLSAWLSAAADEYQFDRSKVYAVGFSNGANTAGAFLLLHPEQLAGVIAFGTTKSFAKSPAQPSLAGKKVWIANGAVDGYSPIEKTRQMIDELESLGAEVQYLEHSGGHTIVLDHVQEINRQLAYTSSN